MKSRGRSASAAATRGLPHPETRKPPDDNGTRWAGHVTRGRHEGDVPFPSIASRAVGGEQLLGREGGAAPAPGGAVLRVGEALARPGGERGEREAAFALALEARVRPDRRGEGARAPALR